MNKEHVTANGEGNHNPLRKPMEMEISKLQTVLEVMLEEIFARLTLRSIARFKSVCKTWKSLIESPYFRRLFVSVHQSSCSSWSLMFPTDYRQGITEPIGFRGCETWDLPKSIHSYVLDFQRSLNLPDHSRCYYLASSNGLVWIQISGNMMPPFVGNPVLQEWVEIPPPPEPCEATGLVTRVEEEDGVVSSFKVVSTFYSKNYVDREVWRVYVYSSETGKWTFKQIVTSHPVYNAGVYSQVNLNGMLYLWEKRPFSTERGVVIAHDFYGPEADDQCRVIHLPPVPVNVLNNEDVRRCLTTSGGCVFLVQVLHQTLKLWKLNNKNNNSDDTSQVWHLLREDLSMESVGFDVYFYPMAMDPFDTSVVYLWSR
ncbi:unnamed protein product [Microthlaspi erraticum]|uniref:F-box domain-containing protein n=1 Tax=Microthlaspi erraticum TaxID=1685480 RepID=A0A6D2IEP9_9BRAS|nr:unnamed protein product [Microthlaspi erraticum]CAA7048341.1 unnamed protein product [Microthlaspi erraticum]